MSMYHITLTENGRFCTHVGGAIPTLPEAIIQLETVASTVHATEVHEIFGFKFDRAGTICGLFITDQFGFPISNKSQED